MRLHLLMQKLCVLKLSLSDIYIQICQIYIQIYTYVRCIYSADFQANLRPVSYCNMHNNRRATFEFSIGNAETMQKLPLKSVIFIQKVPFILHIAVPKTSKRIVERVTRELLAGNNTVGLSQWFEWPKPARMLIRTRHERAARRVGGRFQH